MKVMIKVLLWDIDGTLLNFERAECSAIRKCFEAFGLGPCPDALIARYSRINRKYWERLERGEISKQEVLTGRFEEFFGREQIPAVDVAAFNDAYQINLGTEIFFNDRGYELVTRLRGKVKQYAVTNGTSAAQVQKLQKSGLMAVLDGCFISDQMGAEKPDLRFFAKVWETVGTYPGHEVMIVGDSLTSDMKGGNNAGILCCWYNPGGGKRPEDIRIDWEIRDLNEVESLLARV